MKLKAVLLAIWWTGLPIVLGCVWLFVRYALHGIATIRQSFALWFERNFVGFEPLFWWWLTIGLIVSVVILLFPSEERIERSYGYDYQRSVLSLAEKITAGVAAVALVFSFVQLWQGLWDADKDLGRYENTATVFVVPDLKNVPNSVHRLTDNAKDGSGVCIKIGDHDVPSCIRQGDLPTQGWEPRISSFDGAKIVMSRTSGSNQRVSLNTDTITYLNATDGHPARWSGIRDGQGYSQPTEGVVEWVGTGRPTECAFTGDHKLNRAFKGGHLNSMPNYIAQKYPDLLYQMRDVWGFCDDQGHPEIVIPVTQQKRFNGRTVVTDAGVIVLKGSSTGIPDFTHLTTVKAGQFPGPVYPASLTERQRNQMQWAAGRKWKNRAGFGYDPADSDAQEGNNSEFLLESAVDHRLEWVTPLTLRTSNSQLFLAYAVSPADESTGGKLNQMKVYVLSDGDKRQINVDNLEADARNYVQLSDPGFFSSHGKLVEFTPIDGNLWRAFGELNGRVVYRLDITADSSISPKLVSLSPTSDSHQPQPALDCGKDPAQLTKQQLTECISKLVKALAGK